MKENYIVPGAEPSRFAFPFAAVPKGAKVLIYGGGIVGKTYVQDIWRTNHCHITALADRHPQRIKINGVKIVCPEDIAGEEFDRLVIALERQDLAVEVWSGLCSMGILKEKMRWIDPSKKICPV